MVATVLQHLRELIEEIDLENPGRGQVGKELDSMTATEYCSKTFGSDLVIDLVDTVIQSMLGVEGNTISMLSFLHYCKSATGIDAAMSDSKHGAQYMRVREGNRNKSPFPDMKITNPLYRNADLLA